MNNSSSPNKSRVGVKAAKIKCVVLLLGFIALSIIGCKKKPEIKVQLPTPSIKCTTYAYIHCVYDSLGKRYVEIDTVQKSFQSRDSRKENIPGKGLPGFSKRTEQSLQWILLSNAEYKMQTLTTDSLGNFYFNQTVDYTVIRNLFSRATKTHFRNVPFKIIHADSAVSYVTEEYIP